VQNLSNTAWAFSTLPVLDHGPLLAAMAGWAACRVSTFDSQALGNTAWAFARLACWHPPLREAISAAAIAQGSHLQRQSRAALVDSLPATTRGSARLLDDLLSAVTTVTDGMLGDTGSPLMLDMQLP